MIYLKLRLSKSMACQSEDDKEPKPFGKCGFKFSRNLLFIVFGPSASYLYEIINKKLNLNKYSFNDESIIFRDTKLHLIKKDNGFCSFVQNLINKRISNKLLFEKEKIEKFQKNFKKILKNNFYSRFEISNCNRLLAIKNEETFQNFSMNAVKIQKLIRGFLSRKQFFKNYGNEFKKKILYFVIKIQKQFRRFLASRTLKRKLILDSIINKRKQNAFKISQYIVKIVKIIKEKKSFFIHQIVSTRKQNLIKIQNAIRIFKLRKKISNILKLEKSHYVLTYPFISKTVKMVIYINNPECINNIIQKNYTFEFCPIRSMHVLSINTNDFKSGKYRVKLIVDDEPTCDGRYPHIEFSDGQYYNIITFHNKGQTFKVSEADTCISKRQRFDSITEENENTISEDSDSSFLKTVRNKWTSNEVDAELVKNLKNKFTKSFVDIIETSSIESVENFSNNFDL